MFCRRIFAALATSVNPPNYLVDCTYGIMAWASLNKMVINFQKTKEILFHRPNPRIIVYPAAIGVIEQVAHFGVYD